ncbi:hypothetical protein [Thiohalocapsa halophila]|uniref:hypothetical protein n=1 Tax=Thiohalocapsa halophila TaxID=69359 RepID=UPI0019084E14|nr:hypothetical protein [Thiohalocapsa halophila]
MNATTDAFEDLAHALRVLLEANYHAHGGGLLQVDRAEAVGNIEMGLANVLNAFHSLYDALEKDGHPKLVPWYDKPELALLLVLRNARHHNHAKKVRTMHSYYAQTADKIGNMEMYVLLDFPALEEGADTFDVYLSWADFKELLSMPQKETRIRPALAQKIESYLGSSCYADYAAKYELPEERVFFNVVPLIVNAAVKLVPTIKHLVSPRSTEGKTYLDIFQHILPADTRRPEVNCGPIALMP